MMIEIEHDNSLGTRQLIWTRLREYNRENCQWIRDNTPYNTRREDTRYFNFSAADGEELIGGAVGFIEHNWYILDLLFVDEKYRGQGVGKKLISGVEEFSKSSNLSGIRLETWEFQSRGFYEKMGYTVFGELKDFPPGTTVYFLKKVF